MTPSLQRLLSVLDLEPAGDDELWGASPEEPRRRVFGGQVAAQALVAAGRTVPDERLPHSLHAFFIRPGDPAERIRYRVQRVRDGRSFTTRSVTALQGGKAIFEMIASFSREERGIEHAAPMPEAPAPETLPPLEERYRRYAERDPERFARFARRERPFEERPVIAPDPFEPVLHDDELVWIRARGDLPDDPLLHRALLVYAADLTLFDTALAPHGIHFTDPRLRGASLDHSVWFYRSFRADGWLLHAQTSPVAAAGRGLSLGRVYTRDGRLVAATAQEGLMRLRDA